jgi:hypothetical protein
LNLNKKRFSQSSRSIALLLSKKAGSHSRNCEKGKAILWLKDMAKIKRDKIMSVIANQ